MSDRAPENGTEAALLALYRRCQPVSQERFLAAIQRLIDGQSFEDCFTEFFVDFGFPRAEARAKAREQVRQAKMESDDDWRRALT
jgi:hypothetical protein